MQRFVESLVSGNFIEVQKEMNADDADGGEEKIVQSNRELFEKELKEVQKLWTNRLHKLFNLFTGSLAGMSIMHLMVVMSVSGTASFLQLYSPVSIEVNLVFMIFTSIALVLGLAIALVYRHKSEEKMRNMDPFRLEFRQQYLVSLLVSIMIGFSLVLLYILPFYTNKFYYYAPTGPNGVLDSDVQGARGLYGAVNVIFIVTWILQSAFNKASIGDMDLDPETDDSQPLDTDSLNTSIGPGLPNANID